MEEKKFAVVEIHTPVGNYKVRLNDIPMSEEDCEKLALDIRQRCQEISFVTCCSLTSTNEKISFPGEVWRNSVAIYTIVPEDSPMFKVSLPTMYPPG